MPFERKPSPITFWTIAGAVMLGILMADVVKTVVIAAYARIEIERALIDLKRQSQREQERANARAMSARIRADADEKAAQARMNAQRQAEAMAHQRAIEKEQAWRNFYVQPKVCIDPPDSATFTKCANDHIRAKKQFETTYRPPQP